MNTCFVWLLALKSQCQQADARLQALDAQWEADQRRIQEQAAQQPVSYTHLDVYKRQSQGFGCPPIKAARELGSERRETVRSLSIAGEGNLRRSALSTRGPGWTDRWCTSCLLYTSRCV